VLDDFLATVLGDHALDSLRGKWAARLVVAAAVVSVIAVIVVILFVL
jgi:hypothetical protein